MNEAIRKLVAAKVRFVVIGGQAVRYAGLPRFTQDWDLFIPPHDRENLAALNKALADELDMEVLPLGSRGENFIQTFQTKWAVIQFHLIVAGVPRFEEAEAAAVDVVEEGVHLKRLSGIHLLAAKEKAGRAIDQADILFLRKLQSQGKLV